MNKLYCGDNLKIMEGMTDVSIDLTITSPPYDNMRDYNGYTFDFENIAKQLFRITKEGGVVVWVVGDKAKDGDESGTSFRQALYFKEIGFKLADTMIYQKSARGGIGSPYLYLPCFEYMFIFSKGKIKTSNMLKDRQNKDVRKRQKCTDRQTDGTLKHRYREGHTGFGKRVNVWQYHTGLNVSTKDKIAYKHPAIFPEKLAEDHILSWSNEGDLILDPMCGSGTTCKMAMMNNRQYIGIDISEEYIKISEERLKQLNLFTEA